MLIHQLQDDHIGITGYAISSRVPCMRYSKLPINAWYFFEGLLIRNSVSSRSHLFSSDSRTGVCTSKALSMLYGGEVVDTRTPHDWIHHLIQT